MTAPVYQVARMERPKTERDRPRELQVPLLVPESAATVTDNTLRTQLPISL